MRVPVNLSKTMFDCKQNPHEQGPTASSPNRLKNNAFWIPRGAQRMRTSWTSSSPIIRGVPRLAVAVANGGLLVQQD